jgi:hypothetical protein
MVECIGSIRKGPLGLRDLERKLQLLLDDQQRCRNDAASLRCVQEQILKCKRQIEAHRLPLPLPKSPADQEWLQRPGSGVLPLCAIMARARAVEVEMIMMGLS